MSILSVDFGTSNTIVSLTKKDKTTKLVSIDPENESPTILKTIIYTPRKGHWIIGQKAIDQYIEEEGEGRFFRSIKKFLPDEHFLGTEVHGVMMKIEQIIAVFLREIKKRVLEVEGIDSNSILLGHPALFSNIPKEHELALDRLKKAAIIAGFEHIHFLEEPTAAAYDYKQTLNEKKLVLICDFGGGTSDFTLVKLGKEKLLKEDVLNVFGIYKAGDSLDSAIMKKHFLEFFGSKIHYKIPMGNNDLRFPKRLLTYLGHPAHIPFLRDKDIQEFLKMVQRFSISKEDESRIENLFKLIDYQAGYFFYSKIEQAKIELTSEKEFNFFFKLYDLIIEKKLIQKDVNQTQRQVINDIMKTLDETLIKSDVLPSQIDSVCVTGGSGKHPLIKDELEKRFGIKKLQGHNNFHSINQGLAQYALELL